MVRIIVLGIFMAGAAACSTDAPPVCPENQPYEDLELAGTWHVLVTYDVGGRFVTAVGIAGASPEEVRMRGRTAVAFHGDRTGFAVTVEIDPPQGDAPGRTATLTACYSDAAGAITGTYEDCTGEDCYPGQVIGKKLVTLAEPVAEGMGLVSEYGGPASGEWRANGDLTLNVRVRGGLAYLARDSDGLRIVDLGDPARPTERGHAPVADPDREYYNDVKLADGPDGRVYALMASNRRGVVVIDVSDPDAPQEVTTFPAAAEVQDGVPSVHTLFVEGTRAYLACSHDDSLCIYDVTDPARPAVLGRYAHPLGGSLHDLYVEDGRAYLNYWNLGLVIVDTRDNPQTPALVGEFSDYGDMTSHSNWVTRAGGRLVSVHGDEGFGAHVRIVDVDDQSPEFLKTLGSYQTRPEVSVHNIMAVGELAYVTYYQDGLRVLDLKDPTRPQKIAHYHTWPGTELGRGFYEGAIGVDVEPETGLIYLADTLRGLFVLAPEW